MLKDLVKKDEGEDQELHTQGDPIITITAVKEEGIQAEEDLGDTSCQLLLQA